jgi:hypothetical protein
MDKFFYSLYPQVSHFFRALGDNPALIVIIVLACGSVAYAAWRRKTNS